MSLQNRLTGRRDFAVNNPGKLDRRVSLLSAVNTQNASGELIPAWVAIATVWASKRAISGSRLIAEDGKHNLAIVDFRIRHRADIQPTQRLIHGNDTYEILNTAELGRAHFLDLTCRAFDQTIGAGGTSPAAFTFTAITTYTNATGDTAIAANAYGYDTATVTFSGSASTRNLILAAGKMPGAVMQLSLLFPATLGINAKVRNLTAGGTLLYDLSSDASGASAALTLIWNGLAWTTYSSVYPA